MHDCKNIDTFIPGKMGKFLEKSGNFVSEKSGNPEIYKRTSYNSPHRKCTSTVIPIIMTKS